MKHLRLKPALLSLLLSLSVGCSGSSSGGSDTPDSSNSDDATAQDDAGDNGVLANWCSSQPDDFSFFVTSMDALWLLSESTPGDLDGGFGGDFGGIAGADAICQSIGAATGNGDRQWRAFLSATDDGNGQPVNAIERIGQGPWHDANGRLVATGISGLLQDARPDGDPQSTADLPDECGVPTSALGDAHDVVTASNAQGMLDDSDIISTCNDWTSTDANLGARPRCGHSFPRMGGGSGQQWLSDHPLRGCSKGANLIQNGPGEGTCIGCSGGYGALYCFAL